MRYMKKNTIFLNSLLLDGTFFLYIETSSGLVNYAARLESVTLGPNRDMCTMFWYHMYGTGINQLSLYIKNSTGVSNLNMLWDKEYCTAFPKSPNL